MLIFVLCTFGLFPLLGAVLPVPAIVPVLLYIGLVIGAQAFRAVPKAHYAAIVLAIVPNVAAWATGLIDNTLAAAGTSASESASGRSPAPAWSTRACCKLGAGAVLAGMVLGAIAVFMIDRRFMWAAGYAFFGAALAAIGLIHGEEVEFFADLEIALGYAFLGLVCLAFASLQGARARGRPDDPVDVADAAEASARRAPAAPPARWCEPERDAGPRVSA